MANKEEFEERLVAVARQIVADGLMDERCVVANTLWQHRDVLNSEWGDWGQFRKLLQDVVPKIICEQARLATAGTANQSSLMQKTVKWQHMDAAA